MDFTCSWIFTFLIILAIDFVQAVSINSDSYDVANLRRDYISRYCLPTPLTDQQNIDQYLNCTTPGLVFENVTPDLNPAELYARNRTVFETWCSTWDNQRMCEKDNKKYVEKCFTDNPSISVGFDLLTGFFESACKRNGEALPDLIIYLRMLREWCWYDERQIFSCFDHTNLHYFKRNIKLILPCLQHQLSYCQTSFVRNGNNESKDLLKNITNEIEAGYISSRYVFLISVNASQISDQTSMPIGTAARCPNATFAYIAFFILLALVLIILGALVSLKARSLNLPCFQTRNALVENDGNAVEL